MPACDKISTPDDCQQIRDSLEDAINSEVERINRENEERKEISAEIERYYHDNSQSSSPTTNADLSISSSKDPFKDPVDHYSANMREWWTTTGNHIKVWTDRDGQINYEIFSGPDRGLHKFYDPEHRREGITGIQDPSNPSVRRHDHDGK